MKKNHSLLFLAVALIASNGSQPSAFAAEAYDMPEVVVTATRTDREVEKIPAYVQVVTADQIRDSGAKSVPEALKSLISVNVSNNNRDIVDIGGFGETAANNVVVLVDGRKINPIDLSGPNWGSIPLANIERIEVVNGASSVLYGDRAMGGVLNIITKMPTAGSSVRADVSGGSYGMFKTDGSVSIGNEKVSLLVGGSHYTTDGYRDHSEETRDGIYSRFQAKASDRFLFKADFSNTYDKYNLPGYLTAAQMSADRRQVGWAASSDSRLTQMGSGIEYTISDTQKLFLDFASLLEKRTIYGSESNLATKTLSPKYLLTSPIAGHDNRLTVGADYQVMDFETGSAAYDRKLSSIYTQNEFGLTNDLLLSLGFRYEGMAGDYLDNADGLSNEMDKSEWAAEIGLAYNFMPKSKVYAKISRSYRYPVVDEMYYYATDDDWNGVIDTPARFVPLTPSESVNYEVGSSYAPNSSLVMNIRCYLMNIDDEILLDKVNILYSSFGTNVNYPETRHLGTDFDIRYNVTEAAALFGGIAYTDAEFTVGDYDGKKIPAVPAWKGNVGAEYDFGHGLHSKLTYNYVGSRYAISDQSNVAGKLPEYGTLDLALNYQMSHVDIYLNATNVFNEKYSSYAVLNGTKTATVYYPMPEAQYTIGMRVKF